MSIEPQEFIKCFTDSFSQLYKKYWQSRWEASVSSTAETQKKETEAQKNYLLFLSDPDLYAKAQKFHSLEHSDPLIQRQLKLIYNYTAKNQGDKQTIAQITQLESEIRKIYNNFRASINGISFNDNDLDNILRTTSDTSKARDAWIASKQIGLQVSDKVRELARIRNKTAQSFGYRDYFHQQLELQEIPEKDLLAIFNKLEQETREPFNTYKNQLDSFLSKRFNIPTSNLRPWHYGDRFFQKPPNTSTINLDTHFSEHDIVALALKTYDSMNIEVRDILKRSDLYEKPGKCQHAFCMHIDREGDIRTLNNIRPTMRWNETLLHELGHGIFEKHLDYSLPWLLREPPHMLTTEGIAIAMGNLTADDEWTATMWNFPTEKSESICKEFKVLSAHEKLIFTRWVFVMTFFEQQLYRDPDQDLDTVWWDLVEKYQLLTRPENHRNPDWASKIHIATVPIYYHNYELGHLCAAQVEAKLRSQYKGIINRPESGEWLMNNFFKLSGLYDWQTHMQKATQEPINTRYFLDSIQK